MLFHCVFLIDCPCHVSRLNFEEFRFSTLSVRLSWIFGVIITDRSFVFLRMRAWYPVSLSSYALIRDQIVFSLFTLVAIAD